MEIPSPELSAAPVSRMRESELRFTGRVPLDFLRWRSLPLTLIEDYASLSEEIRNCNGCPLCASRHTVVVDRGDPTARLMFLGEAPGANEDAQGYAFVGKAGAELDALVAEAGVEKFIIANVLKCRPPNNKFPGDDGSFFEADIVSKCLPWLDRQLDLIRPRAIILVGGKAAAYTIYRGRKLPPVKNIVGQWMRSDMYPGVELFGMYHTSYMLRLKNYDPSEYERVREQTISTMVMAQKVASGELPSGKPMVVSERKEKGDQLSFF